MSAPFLDLRVRCEACPDDPAPAAWVVEWREHVSPFDFITGWVLVCGQVKCVEAAAVLAQDHGEHADTRRLTVGEAECITGLELSREAAP